MIHNSCPPGWRQLLQLLGLGEHADSIMAAPNDDIEVRAKLSQIFRSRTRAEWQQVFDGTDACVTPVLRIDEVMTHSQNLRATWRHDSSQCRTEIQPNSSTTSGQ
jgi:alpha-methylacyl-CoA racemase